MCPDQESNRGPFTLWNYAQPTELQQWILPFYAIGKCKVQTPFIFLVFLFSGKACDELRGYITTESQSELRLAGHMSKTEHINLFNS